MFEYRTSAKLEECTLHKKASGFVLNMGWTLLKKDVMTKKRFDA